MGERIEKFSQAIKKDKKLLVIFIIAVIGIILLIVSELISASDIEENKEDYVSTDTYVQSIEKKLSEIISSIEGAGEAKVMVTLETGEENIYAKEVKSDEQTNGDKISSNYEYEYIVIKSGSSNESGMLLKVVEPSIRGVAVVCDGGDNASVRENIINTVSCVLDIKTNKISVCKKNA